MLCCLPGLCASQLLGDLLIVHVVHEVIVQELPDKTLKRLM